METPITKVQTLKAVLFDLDDTLLDWSGVATDWTDYEASLLQQVFDYICAEVHPLPDVQPFTTEFYRRTRAGWDSGRSSLMAPHIGKILVETAEALGVPAGKLNDRNCLEVYPWRAVPGCKMFPEVPRVLQLLADNGVKVGIVTNAYQPMWVRDIEIGQHGLLPYFPDCRISAADVGYLKPHPAIFKAALKQLGVTAEEAVFVGDNPTADIAGAQAVGLRGILRVAHRVPPMLSGLIIPDAALNTLEELPEILDNWYSSWRSA